MKYIDNKREFQGREIFVSTRNKVESKSGLVYFEVAACVRHLTTLTSLSRISRRLLVSDKAEIDS